MIAPMCLAIAERASAFSVQRRIFETREQFGQPIGHFQMIRAKLADMYLWIETMRSFTYRVLRRATEMEMDEGGSSEIHKPSAASVMYAADTLNKVLNDAVRSTSAAGISGSRRSMVSTGRTN
jgi:isovaleryl-CoA dehydrogenase